MNSHRRRYINDVAESLIDKLNIQIPVENIESLANSFEVLIKIDDTLNFDGKLVRENEKFVIYIPPDGYENRDKFTVAHELGHLVFHMDLKSDDTETSINEFYRNNLSTEKEYEANEFAAALLMPRTKFLDKLEKEISNGSIDMYVISDYFRVSLRAAINRARFLGVID